MPNILGLPDWNVLERKQNEHDIAGRNMQTVYITVERDREARSSRDGARFRVRVSVQPGSPALLWSTRQMQSVAQAKREAEAIFGPLVWRAHEDGDEVRASAITA